MYQIKTKFTKSAKGNIYLAVNGFNNGRKVADICIFEGQEFKPYGKFTSKGQRNLWEKLLNYLDEIDLGDKTIADHEEDVYKFKQFDVAVTDIACVCGVDVVADGAYLVINNKAYWLDGWE